MSYLDDAQLDSGALRNRLLSSPNGLSYFDESVGRRQFAWDTVNNRWQMVYGDTGWRVNPGWFGADWDESNFYVRRVGWTVQFHGYLLRVTASGTVTSTALAAIPTGWRSFASTDVFPGLITVTTNYAIANNYGSTHVITLQACGVTLPATWAANNRWYMPFTYQTTDAWPASNPGTAAGTVPFA